MDDGYVAGVVRSRCGNGFVGNVYRWLNAPEPRSAGSTSSYRWWSLVSASTPWMRLPSTLLACCAGAGVAAAAPPAGAGGAPRGAPWVAALAFTTWWVPFNLGLRPTVGRGRRRAASWPWSGRWPPAACCRWPSALAVAGATTAVTPGGLMAFAPVLAAAVPLLRLRAAPTCSCWGAGARAAGRCLLAAPGGGTAADGRRPGRGRARRGRPRARPDRRRAAVVRGVERYALLLAPGASRGRSAAGRRYSRPCSPPPGSRGAARGRPASGIARPGPPAARTSASRPSR